MQGEDLYSHFVTKKVVTLSDYNDSSDKFHNLPRKKAEWLLQKISGHLAAGSSKSFHIMLSLMQQHGDIVCEELSDDIETRISKFYIRNNPFPCKYSIKFFFYWYCICKFSGETIVDNKAIKIDFSSLNHQQAFIKLMNAMRTFFNMVEYSVLQQACIMYIKGPDGLQYSDEAQFISKVENSNQLKDLLLVLVGSDYWSWLDTRLLEAMVHATDINEAKLMLESYDDHISALRLNEVFHDVPVCLLSPSHYDTVVKKFDKHENELTVGDIKKHQFHLEKLSKTADVKLWKIKTGCLEFVWLIPKWCTKQAYEFALANPYKFDALMLLKIGSFPAIFSSRHATTKLLSSGKIH